GTYTLLSGFYEFYAAGQDRVRQAEPTLVYGVDGDTETDKLGTIKLSTTADKTEERFESHVFTIRGGAENIRLSYQGSGGEGPILSWFAVANGDATEELDGEEATDPEEEPADAIDINIDAADIPADSLNGLTFKGVGTLSANSTSAALMEEQSEHPEAYAELLRV